MSFGVYSPTTPVVDANQVIALQVDSSGRLLTAGTSSQATPTITAGKQESFPLVAANTPSSQQTVYGGDYIFAQQATAYGTVTLQVLGPDGTTWQTLVSKTSSDTAGGTGVALSGNAVVRSTVTGTTAAVATLSRVPS